MNDLLFEEASAHRHEAIRELINLVQPHVPWDRDYFAWQYLTNPAGRARVWIARSGDRVVANYVAVPHRIKVEEREPTGWMIQDVLTHPEFRGRGIMHELAERCTAALCTPEYPLNYTFPNEYSHQSFIRRGWRAAYRIPHRAMPLDRAARGPAASGSGTFELSPVAGFDQEFDHLWEAARTRFRFAVCRDSSYLSWRYLKRPGAEYFPFALKQERLVVGLLVMKIFDAGGGRRLAHICDLLTAPSAVDGTAVLLAQALRFGRERGADRMTAWLPIGHPDEHLYDRTGFELDRTLPRWLVIHAAPSVLAPDEAVRAERWHLSMSDSDVY